MLDVKDPPISKDSPDRDFAKNFLQKVSGEKEKFEKVCQFVAQRIHSENADYFKSLPDDIKFDACVNYIAIGLISGDIKKNELVKLAQ